MPDNHYDVIVIGSGPGGASLAQRLAPSGLRILLIERGDYLHRSPANWSSQSVFVDAEYQAKETWYGNWGQVRWNGVREAILPPHLFGLRAFSASSALSQVVGFAMFGAITYLPLYLQVVKGASPTGSGLRLIAMMAGLLLTSTLGGQIIARWGRYKIFPIAGCAVFSLGLFLLSSMNAQGGTMLEETYMFVLEFGLGLVMPVLVVVVQNVVPYRDLGAATSGVIFFRSIGGSFGVATFGAIFSNVLVTDIAKYLPASASANGASLAALQSNPMQLHQLPPAIHAGWM